MPNKKLSHVSIGTSTFTSQATQIIILTASFAGRKLVFEQKTKLERGDPDSILPTQAELVDPTITERLDIKIDETCFVQIWLHNVNLDWFWRSADAITTVEPLKGQYTQLEYWVDGQWTSNPDEEARCQGIRFGAIRRPGSNRVDDPFNLNLMLEWDGEEVLPITIDPDIQNPKT